MLFRALCALLYFKEDINMKKRLFAICMAALMLTGCGSTAPSGGSSAAGTGTSAASPEKTKDAQKTEKQESGAREDEELVYDDTVNTKMKCIDMPRPKRMVNGGLGKVYYATHSFSHRDYHNVDDVVFYRWLTEDPAVVSKESFKDLSAEELVNMIITGMKDYLNDAFGEWLSDDYPPSTIDAEEEKEMLGYKVKRYSGMISFRGEEKKVHYILNLAFVDNEQVLWWISFTRSDAQSELDEMLYLADLPLNKAKFHES